MKWVFPLLLVLCLFSIAHADTTYVAKGQIPSGIWIKEFSPYVISDTIWLTNGNTLYIEYGCELLFEDDAVFYIEPQSKLIAGKARCFGDSPDSVWFKYAGPEDDTLVGWDGLRFREAIGCTLDHCHISGVVVTGPSDGGAVSNNGGALSLTNSLITNNIGGGAGGGGVYVQTNRNSRVTHCTITNNKSYGSGGGLYVDATELTHVDGNFIYNNRLLDGSKNGGGAFITGSSSFEDDSLLWNVSHHDGGGLFVIDYNSDIVRPILQFNLAHRYGGALAINSSDRAVLEGDICYNYALALEGAGVYIFNNAYPTLTNCIVAHNDGGGIWCSSNSPGSYLKIINCTISNNYSGAGLHLGFTYGGAQAILFNTAITYNTRYSEHCQQLLMESSSNIYISHSFFEDTTDICNSGYGDIYLLEPHELLTGNPAFADTSECGGLGFIPSCAPASDLIDVGAPFAVISGDTIRAPENDFLGNPRFLDLGFDIGAIENGCLGARERTDLPDKDGLLFAKPNPFNSTVSIEYEVAHAAEIDIDAFDMSGRKIASIMHGFVKQGRHETRWEPTALPSGIYNIRLRIDGAEYVNKVTYIK
ncbi:right-handed parallel beta-helix repeat-containing protein [bacterium]|nr:right-handed parallel beta-helix repeat-containing protein [bacterium]